MISIRNCGALDGRQVHALADSFQTRLSAKLSPPLHFFPLLGFNHLSPSS
jgi:hypothetical protein